MTEELQDTSTPDLTPTVALPPFLPVHTEAEIQKQDLELANAQIQVLYHLWPQVSSISQVTRMIDASIKATVHRRNLLQLPYGAKSKDTGASTVLPAE